MRHGNRSSDLPSEKFVVAAQNHDQVGNRMLGERLSSLISFEAQKLGAAVLLLSPFVPLIFMGQEYGEKAPFLYFVSLSDPGLVEAVRKGRREEFKEFIWKEEPPDPNGTETFLRSKLDWDARNRGDHKLLLDFYRQLIRMRREHILVSDPLRDDLEVIEWKDGWGMSMKREHGGKRLVCLFNFGHDVGELLPAECGLDAGSARVLDSAEQVWGGPGSLLPKVVASGSSLEMKGDSVAVFLK
jgi:maltooligosyltrehalose trehalohydrolase